uniref:Uncharacterized protein n=1 Tax=Trichogramma kaykai TaxID=54128 RepID=A0ABD2VTJ1_9HYME
MDDKRLHRQDEDAIRIFSSLSSNSSTITTSKIDRLLKETKKALAETDRKRPRIESAGPAQPSGSLNDDNDWQQPKRPAKSQRLNTPSDPDKTLTSNRFSPLQVKSHLSNTHNEPDNNQHHEKSSDDSIIVNKIPNIRPPPLHTTNTNFTSINTIIKNIGLKGEFTFRKTDSTDYSFYPKTMTVYNALKTNLDNAKIKFYTYTPKHLKLKNIVR